MSLTIGPYRVISVTLKMGFTGPWFADFVLDSVVPYSAMSGLQTLTIDGAKYVGTVDRGRYGSAIGATSGRIVGGAGRWGATVAPKHYHDDAGVRTAAVLRDLAAACGETMGTVDGVPARTRPDYSRPSEPAATTLANIIGTSATWRVRSDGTTEVAPVGSVGPVVPADAYVLTAWSPESRLAEIATPDASVIAIGSRIDAAALGGVVTVRDVEISVSSDERIIRLSVAMPDDVPAGASKLADVFGRLVARSAKPEALWGVYAYRVVSQSADRVTLQSATPGMPDMRGIRLWHGVPGVVATLVPGADVLVGFVGGDRSRPYVQSYVAMLGPAALAIGGPVASCSPAARTGDAVEVTLPPASFSGTIGGSPATGTVTWAPPQKATGVITGGSTVVRIG